MANGKFINPIKAASSGGSTPIGATLTKSGQTTSYRTGDDGDIEAGRGSGFFTLIGNNPFGNTNRFTDTSGGSTYANDIAIDWNTFDGTTVLGIKRTLESSVIFNTGIDNALASTHGGFSGWRMINARELTELFNYENPVLNYAPFNIAYSNNIQCSSIWKPNTAYRFAWFSSTYQPTHITNPYPYLIVRTFTVTGTTLS